MKKIQEIIEGNKLIAEFVDLEVLANPHLGGVRPKLSNSTPKELLEIIFCEITYEGGSVYPQFDTSWNWLMPVVEKIEKMNNYTCIERPININDLHHNYFTIDGSHEFKTCSKSKIEAVWKGVIEFIKLYNEKNRSKNNS